MIATGHCCVLSVNHGCHLFFEVDKSAMAGHVLISVSRKAHLAVNEVQSISHHLDEAYTGMINYVASIFVCFGPFRDGVRFLNYKKKYVVGMIVVSIAVFMIKPECDKSF